MQDFISIIWLYSLRCLPLQDLNFKGILNFSVIKIKEGHENFLWNNFFTLTLCIHFDLIKLQFNNLMHGWFNGWKSLYCDERGPKFDFYIS